MDAGRSEPSGKCPLAAERSLFSRDDRAQTRRKGSLKPNPSPVAPQLPKLLRSHGELIARPLVSALDRMRLPDKSSGSTSPRFSRQSRSSASSSSPMMIRASEPPTNERRFFPETLDFKRAVLGQNASTLS